MRKLRLEFAAALGLTLSAVLAAVPSLADNDVVVSGAFARASATAQATAGAVYLTIANHGAGTDRLLAVTSPAAGMAMVHATHESNGVMSMDAVPTLDVPSGGTIALTPGGLHIMLTDLKAPLKQGTRISLDLAFAHAGHIVVAVPVKGIAATAP